jgi:hypothetical protein
MFTTASPFLLDFFEKEKAPASVSIDAFFRVFFFSIDAYGLFFRIGGCLSQLAQPKPTSAWKYFQTFSIFLTPSPVHIQVQTMNLFHYCVYGIHC